MLAILGSFVLFCLIGTLVWLLMSGGVLAIFGWLIIISAVVAVAYLFSQRK